MGRRPTKLSNYPWVVVRFDCTLCKRRGRYSLARLAARYGPEQDLNGLLRELAHNCPWWNEQPRKYEPRCGARLVDLEHNLPPRDVPPEPVHRQRQPAREDVPAPRRPREPEPPDRMPMLSDWPAGRPVVITCAKCGRRDVYDRNNLLRVSGDVTLLQLRAALTSDCPRQKEVREQDRCSSSFEGWPP